MQSHASLLLCSSDLTQAFGYKFRFSLRQLGKLCFRKFFSFDYGNICFKCPRVWWCFVVFQRDPAFWIWGRSRSLHVRVLLFSRCVTTVVTVWFISLVTLCMDVVRPYCSNCCSVVVKMHAALNLIKSFLILILLNVICYWAFLKHCTGTNILTKNVIAEFRNLQTLL